MGGVDFSRRNASGLWGATLRGDNEAITVGEGSNVAGRQPCCNTDMGSPLTIGANVTIRPSW